MNFIKYSAFGGGCAGVIGSLIAQNTIIEIPQTIYTFDPNPLEWCIAGMIIGPTLPVTLWGNLYKTYKLINETGYIKITTPFGAVERIEDKKKVSNGYQKDNRF